MIKDSLQTALRELGLEARPLLVAVSGGVDSMTLLHVAARLARERPLRLAVAHVDHGLRGAESDADQAFVAEAARCEKLSFLARCVAPKPLREGVSSLDRPTLQEAARELRYAALYEMAQEAGDAVIVTAHTADDQAETLLLRLLRGTGPDGLAGMPRLSPDRRIARPFLQTTRAEILDYAEKNRIAWREDASNASDAYTRNRLRRHWLPGLKEEFNPQLVTALCNLAEAQRVDREYLEAQAREAAPRWFEREAAQLRFVRRGWETLPEALARRVVRLALLEMGAGRYVSRTHLARVLDFLRHGRTGTQLELPSALLLICERDAFCLRRTGSKSRGAC